MRPFFFTFNFPPSFSPLFKIGLTDLLCEKAKQYPALYNKRTKGYRKKDVVKNAWNAETKNLKFNENGNSKLILFYMLYVG